VARVANSRRRRMLRASSRLARFAQAMSSSRPQAARVESRAGRVFVPVSFVIQGRTMGGRPATPL